jgi:son of sevenless-like protein
MPRSITFTNEGNPKYKPSPRDHSLKLINFDKYTKLGKIAVDFQKYQTVSFLHHILTPLIFLPSHITSSW